MNEQTLTDLKQVENIISQRRYELALRETSSMEGVYKQETSSFLERTKLALIHFTVRIALI